MPEAIPCPRCGAELRLQDELIGKEVKCPRCRAPFTASAPASASPPTLQFSQPESAPAAMAPAANLPATSRPQAVTAPTPAGGKPKEVDYIANMMLYGGIWACVGPLLYYGVNGLLGIFTKVNLICCINPLMLYSFVLGAMSIMTALKLRGPEGHLQEPPRRNAIMQLVNILNFDLPNAVMGGLALSWLKKPEVAGYYQGKPAAPPPAGERGVFRGHGVMFRYPPDWKVKTRQIVKGVEAWHISVEGDNGLVQVQVYPALAMSPDEQLDNTLEAVRGSDSMQDWQVTRQAGTLAGRPSVVADYTANFRGAFPVRGRVEAVSGATHLVLVSWQCLEANLAERGPVAEALRDSLTFAG